MTGEEMKHEAHREDLRDTKRGQATEGAAQEETQTSFDDAPAATGDTASSPAGEAVDARQAQAADTGGRPGDAAEASGQPGPAAAGDGADPAAAAEGETGTAAQMSRLEAELAQAHNELDALRQQLLRVHADFDNFRKRTRQEKEDLQKFAERQLLSELLPVVDNFERALAAFAGQDKVDDVRAGVEMVHRQLLGILEKHGVQPMEVVGKKFDPSIHEAVMQEPAADGTEPGTVIMELQKGYWLHDKVLRPAMVKVSV